MWNDFLASFFPSFFFLFFLRIFAFEGRRNESGVFKRPKQSSAREESKAAAKSSTTTNNNNRKEEINISDYNSSLLSFSLSLSLLSIYYCLD